MDYDYVGLSKTVDVYAASGANVTFYNSIVALKQDALVANGSVNAYNTLSAFNAWTRGDANKTYKNETIFVGQKLGDDYDYKKDGPYYALYGNDLAINTGDANYKTPANGYGPDGAQFDLAGNARVQGAGLDLGAYEAGAKIGRETPSIIVTTLSDEVNPFDGEISLREALEYFAYDEREFNADVDATGQTITFELPYTTNPTITIDEAFVVSESMTIDASSALVGGQAWDKGVTIDAQGKDSVFVIKGHTTDAPALVLNEITATNGLGGNIVLSDGAVLVMNGGGALNAQNGAGVVGAKNTAIYLNDATVSGNENTNGYGGGVSASEGVVYINNSQVTLNKSATASAVYAANLYVTNSSFMKNEATSGLGAVVVTAQARLTNALIAENTSETGIAGLVAMRNSTVDVYNGTIVNNGSDETGAVDLYVETGAKFAAYNSIIGLGKDSVVADGAVAANYTLSAFDAWTGGANNFAYDGTDLFVAGYFLKDTGLTRDLGNNAYVTPKNGYGPTGSQFDLAKAERMQGAAVDLGAYEFRTQDAMEKPSIIVTTLRDTVDPYDGEISLREAVEVYFKYEDRLFNAEVDPAGKTVTFDLADYFAGKFNPADKRDINRDAIELEILLDPARRAITVDETMGIDATNVYLGLRTEEWVVEELNRTLRVDESVYENGEKLSETFLGYETSDQTKEYGYWKQIAPTPAYADGVTVNALNNSQVFELVGHTTSAPSLTTFEITATRGKDAGFELSDGAVLVMNGGGVNRTIGSGIVAGQNTAVYVNNAVVDFNVNFDGVGGGISAPYGTVYINDSTFTRNGANSGGAVYAANLYVTNSTFKENYAFDMDGVGAIVISSQGRLTNALIADNFSFSGKSGLVVLGNATVDAYNVTLANNGTADLYVGRNANVTLYNSIVGVESVGGVENAGGAVSAYNTLSAYTDWTDGANNPTYAGGKVFLGENALGVPKYVLAVNSQALNSGENGYVLAENGYGAKGEQFDLAYNARIADEYVGGEYVKGIVDLGAYEAGGFFETPSIIVTTLSDEINPYDGEISLREAAQVYFRYSELADGSIDVTARLYDAEVDPNGMTITFDLPATEDATIKLTNGPITVADNMIIDAISAKVDGESWTGGVTLDAQGRSIAIETIGTVTNAPTLVLNEIAVENGLGAGVKLSAGSNLAMNGGGVYRTTGAGIVGGLNSAIHLNSGATIALNVNENGFGGGISAAEGTVYLEDATVTGNTAGVGGGIYAANVIANRAYVAKNKATGTASSDALGGALVILGRGLLTNSLIVENSATANDLGVEYGGLVALRGANVELYNTTITNNDESVCRCEHVGKTCISVGCSCGLCQTEEETTATVVDLYAYGATVTACNTIVGLTDDAVEIANVGARKGKAIAYNTLSTYTAWTGASANNIAYDGTATVFDADADADAPYMIAADGLAAGAGDTTFVAAGNGYGAEGEQFDFAGNARIVDDAVDLGAYALVKDADDSLSAAVLDAIFSEDAAAATTAALWFYGASSQLRNVAFDGVNSQAQLDAIIAELAGQPDACNAVIDDAMAELFSDEFDLELEF